MKRWPILFTMLFLGISTHASQNANQTRKAPWLWTIDERLAARYDSATAAVRVREHQVEAAAYGKRAAAEVVPTPSGDVDFISGRAHPELLLSRELFDYTMLNAYADDPRARSIFREWLTPRLAATGLPADFWRQLELLSLPYLSDSKQLYELHRGRRVTDADVKRRIADETVALENLKCRDRADAIAAARKTFGEKFDRFLYESVAPSMFVAIGHGGEIPESREREIERGCR